VTRTRGTLQDFGAKILTSSFGHGEGGVGDRAMSGSLWFVRGRVLARLLKAPNSLATSLTFPNAPFPNSLSLFLQRGRLLIRSMDLSSSAPSSCPNVGGVYKSDTWNGL
jgi:hypothetical protein